MSAYIARGLGLSIAFGLVACAGLPSASPSRQDSRFGMPDGATAEEVTEARRLLGIGLDRWISLASRIQEVSQRIRLAGAELCGDDLSPVLGAAFLDLDSLPPALAPMADERFGRHEGPRVVAVFDGMAAARVGIMRGDTIVSFAGARTRSIEQLTRPRSGDDEVVSLAILRDGQQLSLRVPNELGCSYPAYLRQSDLVNAETNGKRLMIDRGLVRELPDDASLAFVIGHEVAHNTLKVRRGRTSWSRIRTEAQADYLGCYLAARAGYPLLEDAGVFETLVRDINRLGERSATHPNAHERTLAFRMTIAEIREKRARGQSLEPTLR